MIQFGMFAKHWTPGTVKTRLAVSIGEELATEFHRVCVTTILDRFASLGDRRVVGFSPPDREEAFRAVASEAWTVKAQVAGDLGARMAAWFEEAFVAGATRVVLIGSDSPNLPAAFIQSAFDALSSHDVVLGPSDDGGYYLVGMSKMVSELFVDVDWGSEQVWEQSIGRLDQAGASFHQLDEWYDVDQLPDLQRLSEHLADEDGFEELRKVVKRALES